MEDSIAGKAVPVSQGAASYSFGSPGGSQPFLLVDGESLTIADRYGTDEAARRFISVVSDIWSRACPERLPPVGLRASAEMAQLAQDLEADAEESAYPYRLRRAAEILRAASVTNRVALYHVREDGEEPGSLDLMVVAPTPEAAIAHWRAYFETGESEEPESVSEVSLLSLHEGPLEWGKPGGVEEVWRRKDPAA